MTIRAFAWMRVGSVGKQSTDQTCQRTDDQGQQDHVDPSRLSHEQRGERNDGKDDHAEGPADELAG